MVFARYSKSKRHKKLKNVDPSAKLLSQMQTDPRKSKKKATMEALRIKRLSEQHVPKKLAKLMQYNVPAKASIFRPSKEDSISGPFSNKNTLQNKSRIKIPTNQNVGDVDGAERPLHAIPKILQQGPYENESSFLRRLNKLVTKVRSEAKIADKYDLGGSEIKQGNEVSNKILRRRERDKKRKNRKKKQKQKHQEQHDREFNLRENSIFLPA